MGTTWDYLDRYRGKEFTGDWPNIAQLMHLTVMNHPENDCFQSIGKDGLLLTFRQVEDKVKQVASRLKELGVNKNSHIAVSGKNSVQWGIAFLSIMYVGAVAVPLDNTLHENEVKNLVEFGDIDWFFGDSDRLEYAKQTCTHIFTLTPDLKEKDVPYVMDVSNYLTDSPVQRCFLRCSPYSSCLHFSGGFYSVYKYGMQACIRTEVYSGADFQRGKGRRSYYVYHRPATV